MPHQCTKCGNIFPDAAEELLKGCNCGSRFFYYIRQERLDTLDKEYKNTIVELEKADKEQIEKDIRELTGMDKELDKPVILDLESVRVLGPGKFELDIVNLFSKNRPLIYKLEEGKYIIDLGSAMKGGNYVVDKKILNDIEEEEDEAEVDEGVDEKKSEGVVESEERVEEVEENDTERDR